MNTLRTTQNRPRTNIEREDLLQALERADILILKDLAKEAQEGFKNLRLEHKNITYNTLLETVIGDVVRNHPSYSKYWRTAFPGYLQSIYRNLQELKKEKEHSLILKDTKDEDGYLVKKLNAYRIKKLKELQPKNKGLKYSKLMHSSEIFQTLDFSSPQTLAQSFQTPLLSQKVEKTPSEFPLVMEAQGLEDPEEYIETLNMMSESEAQKIELMRLLEVRQSQGVRITKKLISDLAQERDVSLTSQEIFNILKEFNK